MTLDDILPTGETIISAIVHKGYLVLATNRCLYLVSGELIEPVKLTPLEFHPPGEALIARQVEAEERAQAAAQAGLAKEVSP